MEALVPRFDAHALETLDELSVGVVWADEPAQLVRARVNEAAALFEHRRTVALSTADDIDDLFRREVADVHRELFAENADLYGDDVRSKIERCLEVTDAESQRAAEARVVFREEAEGAIEGLDLLITPTLGFVAPEIGKGEPGDLRFRRSMIRFTFPFNALGWPVLALPCGLAEHGLPASVQLAGRPGSDALVLAAGRLLEAALAQHGS
jgi:Asp-tRNA(Asn)/Glu-tRNA(Gln) amidotransferase A subunit family amidase